MPDETPEIPDEGDRRRPTVPTLRRPSGPAVLRARVGAKRMVEHGKVLELTDRTVTVEVEDPTIALALNLAPEIEVEIVLDDSSCVVLARPGRRATDIATSRRVELVMEPADQRSSNPR